MAPLGGNMMVVLGISLCLAVILATVVVTVWRRFCKAPQCSSAHRQSVHSSGGRKLSDEATIITHSLQRPSESDSQSPLAGMGVSIAHRDPSVPANQHVPSIPVAQDSERLSPTGQKILPTVFGYIGIIYQYLLLHYSFSTQCLLRSLNPTPGTGWLSIS